MKYEISKVYDNGFLDPEIHDTKVLTLGVLIFNLKSVQRQRSVEFNPIQSKP